MELHAISQYMNQHYGLDNTDYGELAKNVKLIAIDEMRHAEMFANALKNWKGNRHRNQLTKSGRVKSPNGFSLMIQTSKITQSKNTMNFCSFAGRMATARH